MHQNVPVLKHRAMKTHMEDTVLLNAILTYNLEIIWRSALRTHSFCPWQILLLTGQETLYGPRVYLFISHIIILIILPSNLCPLSFYCHGHFPTRLYMNYHFLRVLRVPPFLS
jgi:hypothetical protein